MPTSTVINNNVIEKFRYIAIAIIDDHLYVQ